MSGAGASAGSGAGSSLTKSTVQRLASKPLKLAASSLRPLGLSRNNSSASLAQQSAASTHTVDQAGLGSDQTSSTGAAGTKERTTTTSSSGRGSSTGRRGLIRRRRRNKPLRDTTNTDLTPAQIASMARGARKPLEGEEPAAWVRVRIVRADNLVAKDRNGTSDPFVQVSLSPSQRQTTPVIKRALDPVFPAESSTFDFPLYLSLAPLISGRGIEAVVWDKDLMRKEYMGETALPPVDWFPDGKISLWRDDLPPIARRVYSSRRKNAVSGTVTFQVGFLEPKNVKGKDDVMSPLQEVFDAILKHSSRIGGSAGVLGVPAHEGIGTFKMRSMSYADSGTGPEHSAAGLLRSARAALTRPLGGGHKMEPVPHGAPLADADNAIDSDSDEVPVDDGLSSSSSSDSDDDEDAIDEEDEEEDGYFHDAHRPHHHKHHPVVDIVSSDGQAASDGTRPDLPHAGSSDASRFSQDTRVGRIHDSPDISLSVPQTPASFAGISSSGTATPGSSRRRNPFKRGSKDKGSSSGQEQIEPGGTGAAGRSGKRRRRNRKRRSKGFEFDAEGQRDILGIVVIEIKSAADLPRLKNALRIGYDMDPFVVISFGKKVFRTRVIRHSLNPTWNEKLLFHVRRHETAFTTSFTVLDWDKVSGNDLVGSCSISLDELLADAPKPDDRGLYGAGEDGKHEMKEFVLPVTTDKDMPWEAKHSPKLTIRAKYEPYDALRQRFWRQYIAQYDVDETGSISFTELTAMLDSLASTLTRGTIEGFFHEHGKDPARDELSMEEVILALEREVTKPDAEKAKVKPSLTINSGSRTPAVAPEPAAHGLATTGPAHTISSPVDPQQLTEQILASQAAKDSQHPPAPDGPGNLEPTPVDANRSDVPTVKIEREESLDDAAYRQAAATETLPSGVLSPSAMSDVEADGDSDTGESPAPERERVINIRVCPLCHRPRLSHKSEQDIVTHLAICASNDWTRVDRIVTANYVTSSQAQRKFLTRMMNKVAIGAYSLGANSANILVQDRTTGQLQEEKMAVYVRLGIRVLYKGWRSQMEGTRARRLLKSMSVKQGLKYDSPASAADIAPFIAFHHLNIDEIRDPLDSFKTFNEFFYRKLKPEARPVALPGDEGRLVSCADCRMMAFETVEEATKIWIKGREFSVGRLLGPAYKDIWDRYNGGALGIFRLAPQDYHRFHSPVKGRVGKMTLIDGEYYTVNPQAIRTMLDVYGENVRKVVPVESDEFGKVMTVWVGAMMVGSIATTVEEGQMVERGEELGYFAFGGSTIVCLFEKGVLEWDEDLLNNGRAAIETLVRMGMGIGRSTLTPPKDTSQDLPN